MKNETLSADTAHIGHFASCPGQLKEEHALCGRKDYPPALHIYYTFPQPIWKPPLLRALPLSTQLVHKRKSVYKSRKETSSNSFQTETGSLGPPPPLPYPRGAREYRTDTARNRLRTGRGSRDTPTCTLSKQHAGRLTLLFTPNGNGLYDFTL